MARATGPRLGLAAGELHELVVRVLAPGGGPAMTPDGAEAPPLTARFQTATVGEQLVPGWLVTPMFALAVQWWAAEQGTYTIVVGVGDAEPSQSPLHVLRAPGTE
jgi:hypothetical protein